MASTTPTTDVVTTECALLQCRKICQFQENTYTQNAAYFKMFSRPRALGSISVSDRRAVYTPHRALKTSIFSALLNHLPKLRRKKNIYEHRVWLLRNASSQNHRMHTGKQRKQTLKDVLSEYLMLFPATNTKVRPGHCKTNSL